MGLKLLPAPVEPDPEESSDSTLVLIRRTIVWKVMESPTSAGSMLDSPVEFKEKVELAKLELERELFFGFTASFKVIRTASGIPERF